MTKVKPNFLIVGAAKAGTTSLYYYLKQHLDISFSPLKEPKYFSSLKIKYPQKGKGDWSIDKYAVKDEYTYLNLFKDLTKYEKIGEASPDYLLYHKYTATAIKDYLGDIPIVISLRNPVARAFSAYSNLVRDNREFLNFRDALEEEDARREQGWDFMWQYKNSGMYYEQVKTFKDLFSDVKVVIFEEMVLDPLIVVNEIIIFLGLKELDSINSSKHNPSGTPKNFMAKFILNRNNKISTNAREILKSIIPRSILENVAKKSLQKNHINKVDEEFLIDYYKDDIEKLEKLIDRDLLNWKN